MKTFYVSSRTSVFYGIRFIAVLGIVFGHAGLTCLGGGTALCSLFFILSGFLYKNEDFCFSNYKKYVNRKLKTIYPMYWFCLILFFIMDYIRGAGGLNKIGWDFIPHVLLVQSWFPWGKELTYLGNAWFLSSLVFCYLLSPVVSLFISKYKYTSVALGCLILYSIFINDCWHSSWMTYISPIYRIAEYGLAMWIRRYLCFREVCKSHVPFLGLFVVFLWGLALHFINIHIMIIVVNLLMVWLLYNFSFSYVDKILGNKIMQIIASYIFFIYLTHNIIGFHMAYYFICNNIYVVVLISVLCGIAIGFAYKCISMLMVLIIEKMFICQ